MADDPQLEPDAVAPAGEDASPATSPTDGTSPADQVEEAVPEASSTEAPPEPVIVAVAPVKVEGRNRRTDDDALEGGWAVVVSGEFAGRRGTFDYVVDYSAVDGYPETVALLTRDERNEHLIVSYADLRPSAAGGR